MRNPELVLAIRSLETGEVREIYPKMAWFDDGKSSSDGRFFLTRGRDLKGRPGIFASMPAAVTQCPWCSMKSENALYPVLAPDGKSFFFPRQHLATRERELIQRDLATGMERILLRGRYVSGVNVSPDGRYEDVIIGKSLTLVGKNSANTIIDATGLAYSSIRLSTGLTTLVLAR